MTAWAFIGPTDMPGTDGTSACTDTIAPDMSRPGLGLFFKHQDAEHDPA